MALTIGRAISLVVQITQQGFARVVGIAAGRRDRAIDLSTDAGIGIALITI